MSKREWSASDQIQRHGDEASKKRSGHLIADMGNHREVICTVWFRDCESMIKDNEDEIKEDDDDADEKDDETTTKEVQAC